MGILDKFSSWLKLRRKEAQVLVVGLDNSGKSTIINYLKPDETKSMDIVPTVGFNVEKFQTKGLTLTAFDMSGQGRYRNLWSHYYKDCNGVVFVLDSSDKLRLVVARDELEMLLQHEQLRSRRVPILFFANKMDLRDSLSTVKCSTVLELERLVRDKPWHITASNALTGEGVAEGMEWLAQQMQDILLQGR